MLREMKQGRILTGRLNYQDDLLEAISDVCIKNNIRMASVNAIGAVFNLKCGYYNQKEQQYIYLDEINANEPLEITALTGNVSIKDDKPFLHLHITTSDRKGNCFGGHLMPGVKVYACEFVITELLGDELVRKYDEKTGLNLW